MGTLLPSISRFVEELIELSPDQFGKLARYLIQLRESEETGAPALEAVSVDSRAEGAVASLESLNRELLNARRELAASRACPPELGANSFLLTLVESRALEAEEHFRAVHESLPDMYVVADDVGFRIISCNHRFQERTGSSKDEIVGHCLLDFIHPNTEAHLQSALATLAKDGDCSNCELWLKCKDGKTLPALVASTLMYGSDSETRHIHFWCRDMADLLPLTSFEFLLEALPDAVLLIDIEGRIRASNSVAEGIFGYSHAELAQLRVGTLLPERFRTGSPEVVRTLLERFTSRTGPTDKDLVGVRRNGKHFPASVRFSRLQTSRGNLLIVAVADRTAEKAIKDAALINKERIRLALHSGSIGIWDLDVTTGKSIADARCKAAYGIPPDGEWSSKISFSAIHQDDRDRVMDAVRAAYRAEGSGIFHVEFRTVGVSDGVLRHVQADGQVYFAHSGNSRKPTRFVGVLQDITSRKQSEEALVRANQDLEQFAYAAAHDLQEPLRNVATTMGLLKRWKQSELDEDSLVLINESIESAKRMHTMVRDLLAFTRVTDLRGKMEEQVDSGQALAQALFDLRNIIDETGAHVLSGTLPSVHMHPTHLLQLFTNLLGNAIKYRKHGVRPRIEVAAVRKTPVWQFMITDNGIGFDPAHAEQIFGVFKRLHHQHEYSGTGIGLAICSRIVSLYGGRIWAEGQPGQGATFFFTIPLKSTEGHGRDSAI